MIELVNTPQQEPFKILLIGDSCVDEYKIGTVDRLSPEAPVPVIKIVDTVQVPGMASNVYQNLVNLNCEIKFITNTETITKTRYIDQRSGQHLIRVDDEPQIDAWDGQISNTPWESFHAIIISDYNKGFLTYQHIEQIISGIHLGYSIPHQIHRPLSSEPLTPQQLRGSKSKSQHVKE